MHIAFADSQAPTSPVHASQDPWMGFVNLDGNEGGGDPEEVPGTSYRVQEDLGDENMEMVLF